MTRAPPIALGLALLLCACRGNNVAGTGCKQDSDCGSAEAFRCEEQTGVCYCRTDDACPPSQLCNVAGFCQDRSGCEKNIDCLGDNLFCDTTTGSCLPKGRCTLDMHCPLGQVCHTQSTRCVDGCRSNGDCAGVSCRCGDGPCGCDAGTQAERLACLVGTCDSTFCADDTFCRFGQLCGVPPDAGSAVNQCYSDYDVDRRPYCSNCVYGAGTNICGSGPNYCLIDTAHPGNYFCGADCSDGQACPRGYSCQDVIVVMSQWQCTRADPVCPTNVQLPCTENADCKRGGTCVKAAGQPSGFCAGKCDLAEGDPVGFCSCQTDSDCAQETCSAGECSISRRKCITEKDCRPIHCVDYQGGGGCLIGQNCAPANGLSCLEVQ